MSPSNEEKLLKDIELLSVKVDKLQLTVEALDNKLENHIGIAMPIFFLVIMFSDSYLLGHFTSNLFVLFSSFLYSNQN